MINENGRVHFSVPFNSPSAMLSLPTNSAVLLAFSGGADSRALLHKLAMHCKLCGAPLYCAHVNHGIRGDEALRDRDFCVSTAASYGIECFVLNADVPALAAEHHTSIETEARRVRYDFFDSLMKKYSIPILATAHNADDRLETLIFNIARGSGLRGVCSIPRVRRFGDGYLVRPILEARKEDIIGYCKSRSLEYVTDSTNNDVGYSRNLIRHRVIPELTRVNAGLLINASRLCRTAQDACDFIDSESSKFFSENKTEAGIPVDKLNSLHPALITHVISAYISGSTGKTPELTHIIYIRGLCAKATPHSSFSIPGSFRAAIENGFLTILPDKQSPPRIGGDETESFISPDELLVRGQDAVLISSGDIIPPDGMYICERVSVSPAALGDMPLTVRTLREGDTVRHGKMTKKVRKLLSDRKLPLSERYTLPIICSRGEILWIPGVVLRDGAKADMEHSGSITMYYFKATPHSSLQQP